MGKKSGGELLEIRLLDNQLVNTFWPFQAVFTFLSTARIRLIFGVNWIRAVDKKWQMVDTVEQLTHNFFATVKYKSSDFFI